MSIKHLKHHTVLITGAGSGLGRAMARHFADQGWQVGITDASLDNARQTLAEHSFPEGSFVSELDVSNPEHWQQVHAQVSEQWNGLGVIINNAGVAAAGPMAAAGLSDWEWLFTINVFGVVQGCRQFLPMLLEQNNGHIVNIASFAALAGGPEMSNYGASKASVYAASESLHTELAATDIGITVACPAFIRTDLLSTMRSPEDSYQKRAQRWMDNSGFTAEDFAQAVFKAISKRRFLLLTHGYTRWLWRLKRWCPGIYYWMARRAVRKHAQRRPNSA